MRKNELRQQVDNYFKHHHIDSYRTRKHRHYVLYKTIRDLFHIGSVPNKWHALTKEHIQNLILHWKKEKRQATTIMNYMTVIRFFLNNIDHHIYAIDNKSLGLVKQNANSKLTELPVDIVHNFTNPIAKILFQFQIHFGLTLSEGMRLIPDIHIQKDSIWIIRTIATNSQDRIIPIRNDEQLEIIKNYLKICKPNISLVLTYGYHHLRYVYNTDLQTLNLIPAKSYRFIYARNLKSELSQILSNYMTCQTIMREMGLQSRMTLWRYLNE